MPSGSSSMVAVLVLLFVLGVLLGASSDSWFGMWVGIEVSSIAVYPLVVDENSEATCSILFNYLVVQTVSSGMLYLGMVVLQGSLGMSLGLVMALVGLQLKFGGVFIGWIMNMIEVISWQGVALILGVQKIPVLVVLSNACLGSSTSLIVWSGLVLAVGSCLGCLMISVRSFMLSSSVLNIGWIWCGLGLTVESGLKYFVVYVISFVSLCILFSSNEKSSRESWGVWGFGGLSIAEIALVGSLSGVPPFAVFLCKAELIWVMSGSGYSLECWVLMVLSVLLMYVYMQLVMTLCLHSEVTLVENGLNSIGIVVNVVVIFSLVFCMYWVV